MNQVSNIPKYKIGDEVYFVNANQNKVVSRTIEMIRTETTRNDYKVFYSLWKDHVEPDYLGYEHPKSIRENFFWISESRVFKTKKEVINNLG